MTRHHAPSTAHLVLLVLLTVTPQLAGAAPTRGEGGEGGAEGRARTDHKEDAATGPFLSPPPQSLLGPDDDSPDRGPAGDDRSDKATDPAEVLVALLQALDHPGKIQGGGEPGEGRGREPAEGGEIRRQAEGGRGADKAIEELIAGRLTAARVDGLQERGEEGAEEEAGEDGDARSGEAGWSAEEGGEEEEEEERKEGEEGRELESFLDKASQTEDLSLQRRIRGYFQNIDLGLQNNEILPPLKGYRAYNTQLARAGKKLHWQESRAGNRPVKGGNFMDDFEDEGEELEEEVEEEEEGLSQMEEEARARAEKQEVLRQQEEAERAREEEQRLADIASDMLLQYMGRKQQQQAYMKPREKSSYGGGGGAGNTAEDKRSEEVAPDDDDLDQQMIDRLIEISSKLHLPADDVIEIISDVEEKKKKRKELQQQPLGGGGGADGNGSPVAPRFRPLVPPPLAAPPVYHYTASKNPKKNPYRYNKSNKKWHKDKAKSYKQDYWFKPQKPFDYWYKPQKQFLAFPSYPYYQKPYRAYYPVYFPYPKPQYYGQPLPSSRDAAFGGPQDLDLQAPRRRHRGGGKGRGQGGWKQHQQQGPPPPPPPQQRLPLPPYISNYILPHPRTYQPLPPPKPVAPPRRGRRPPFYYPPSAPRDDYEEDGLVPQLDSQEELENFIESIYMKRRMY